VSDSRYLKEGRTAPPRAAVANIACSTSVPNVIAGLHAASSHALRQAALKAERSGWLRPPGPPPTCSDSAGEWRTNVELYFEKLEAEQPGPVEQLSPELEAQEVGITDEADSRAAQPSGRPQ
jgi:hypothetical protein